MKNRQPRDAQQFQRRSTSKGRAASSRRALAIESLESRLMMAADYGDLPAPYPVILAVDGARHEAVGPQLGATRDSELDGIPSPDANSDGADEDGVAFSSMRVSQLNASATVNVQNAPSGAKLSAWIDFNGDGNFGGPGEQIANNLSMVNGTNLLSFDVPSTARAGDTFARFRLSTAGALAINGPAIDGEVEDYKIAIAGPSEGLGTFALQNTISGTVTAAWNVAPGDIDGDGDMDLVALGDTATDGVTTVYWYESNGAQSFTEHPVAAPGGARSAVVADIDGDGDMDLAVAGDFGIAWYENNGSQTFTSHGVTAKLTFTVAAADVNGDGDIDLVGNGGTHVAWYDNNGNQAFTERTLPGNVGNGSGLAVGDIDRDGDLDFAYTGLTNSILGWYQNNGSQVFTMTNIDTTSLLPRNVVLVDMDKDGDMDFAAVSTNDDSVQWYENNGSQSFTKHTISTTSSNAWNLSAGDYDGDGDIDLVVASQADKKVTLYINHGSQTFSPQVISSSLIGPRAAVFADLTGDGRLDVLLAASPSNTIAWLRQLSPGDYDNSTTVDGADFLLWQRTFGNAVASGDGADGSKDGSINALDLAIWESGMGAPATLSASDSTTSAALSLPDNAFLTSDMFAGNDSQAPEALAESVTQTGNSTTAAADRAIAQLADEPSAATPDAEWLATDHGSDLPATLADSLFTMLAS